MFQTGQIGAKPSGINAGNQGQFLSQAMAGRGMPQMPATAMPSGGMAQSRPSLQNAFAQFQSGTYMPQANNFAFQSQAQMPSAANQMQAAAAQRRGVRSSSGIFGDPAQMSQPMAGLQNSYGAFQAGTYNPQANNFTFQNQAQTQAAANQMQAAAAQRRATRFDGGIGAAVNDMQAMFGGGNESIGAAIAQMHGNSAGLGAGLRSAFGDFVSGSYQPQPSNLTFQQAAPAQNANNQMQRSMRRARRNRLRRAQATPIF